MALDPNFNIECLNVVEVYGYPNKMTRFSHLLAHPTVFLMTGICSTPPVVVVSEITAFSDLGTAYGLVIGSSLYPPLSYSCIGRSALI